MFSEDVQVRVITDYDQSDQVRWYEEIKYLQAQVTSNQMPDDMSGLIRMNQSDSVMLVGLFHSDRLVSMVQGTRIDNLKHSKVFIDSVATDPEYRGLGYGRYVFKTLEHKISTRWPSVNQFVLTNSPRRGNGGFYRSLGYVPRADERLLVRLAKRTANLWSVTPDETYVWVKRL